MDLKDIIAGEGPDISAEPENVEETPEPKEPEPKDEPKEEPKDEPKGEPEEIPKEVVQAPKESEKGLLSATLAERTKRQEVERENAKLREQLEAAKTGEKKDFFDDPEGAVSKAVAQATQEMQQRYESQRFKDLHSISERFARQTHDDYDEKAAVFAELVKNDDGLFNQWVSSDNPAEFAYKAGYAHSELAAVNYDLAAYRKKVAEEALASVKSEKSDIPESTVDLQSAPKEDKPQTGPAPLEAILESAQKR